MNGVIPLENIAMVTMPGAFVYIKHVIYSVQQCFQPPGHVVLSISTQ